MQFFLLTTEHLPETIIFKDEDDFRVAMNYVAVVQSVTHVVIVAFVLMSNHAHFILQCTLNEAYDFMYRFKRMIGIHYGRKYGHSSPFRRNHLDIKELPGSTEALSRAIAYVQMNPVAARVCIHPTGYRWGTGDAFFRERPARGRPIGSFSHREQTRLLHSNEMLPADWIYGDDGYILPESYVCVKFVEKVFSSPARMLYFLNSSSKAKAVREGDDCFPSFRDQIISAAIPDLCRTMFRQESISGLLPAQKAEALRQIRRRFSADPAQIARVTGVPYQEVIALMEKYF